MEASPTLVKGLALVGALYGSAVLLRLVLSALRALRLFVLPGANNLRRYGAWAIVTGSTDGIGKAIAAQLASQKINLLLISRSADKLAATSQELKDKYSVEVRTAAVDMSNTTIETYTTLAKDHGDLDVGIIVNNVGLSYEHPEYLDACSSDRLWKLMHINVVPGTMLIKEFIPGMVSRKKGLVVNVSSMSSVLATPLLAAYGASKSYVNCLTDSLRTEYSDKGVDFQVICPMFVSTAMSGMRVTLQCPTPTTYAKSVIRTFGLTDFTCGYWPHELTVALYSLVPSFIMNSNQLTHMKKARARWFKKQAAKKE